MFYSIFKQHTPKNLKIKKTGPFYETGLSFGGVPTESLQVNLALWGIEG
jgi:hypothetical protein